jgi:hypothetical protein
MKEDNQYRFVPPANAEEAEERRLRLTQEAEDIQVQLQFTNLEEFGDQEGYLKWRRAATTAMNRKHQEARWCRTWKARFLNSGQWKRTDDSDFVFANRLLREALEHYSKQRDLPPYEKQLMNKIRKHLKRCGELD